MPTTVRSGIAFTDLVSSNYHESFSLDNSSLTRPVKTAWGTRRAFLVDMLGRNIVLNEEILRNNPELYTNTDFNPILYCTSIETLATLKPNAAGANPSGHSFDDIEYLLHYAALPYDVLTDEEIWEPTYGIYSEVRRNVERSFTFAAENLQIPGASFRFTTAPKDYIFSPPAKVFPTIEVTYTWYRVPRIPTANINSCIGKINDALFDISSYAKARGVPFIVGGAIGYPPGTLLFLGGEAKTRLLGFISQQGSRATEWDIVYKFLYRNNGSDGAGGFFGWNHLFRPSAGTFQLVTNSGDAAGNRLYRTEDFNILFQME